MYSFVTHLFASWIVGVLRTTGAAPPGHATALVPSLLASCVSTLTVNHSPLVTLATLVRLGVGTTLLQTTWVRGHYIPYGEDIYMNAKLFHV